MIISKVRFLRSVSFKNSQYKIGEEVSADDIPGSILNRLLGMKSVEPIDWIDEDVPEWPLKTDPAIYLEQTPDGPKADLAREILGIS